MSQYAATIPACHLPTVPSVRTQRTIGLYIVSHYIYHLHNRKMVNSINFVVFLAMGHGPCILDHGSTFWCVTGSWVTSSALMCTIRVLIWTKCEHFDRKYITYFSRTFEQKTAIQQVAYDLVKVTLQLEAIVHWFTVQKTSSSVVSKSITNNRLVLKLFGSWRTGVLR